MKYLLIIIIILVAHHFSKQWAGVDQEVDNFITNLDKVENAETIDERIETTESFNKDATKDFYLLTERAKSPASIEFVELTEKQNSLAERGMDISREMQPLVNRLTPEVVSDPEKLTKILIPLCFNMSEFIPVISDALLIINTKSDLINEHPIIAKELMDDQQDEAKKIMSHMISSQNRILEREKKAYGDLYCDDYLALDKN